MKVITENEVIIEKVNPCATSSEYYNADGALADKLKGLVGSGKVKGAVDSAKGLLGGLGVGKGKGSAPMPRVSTAPPPPPQKKKMSTGVKIGIGVGVAAVLGLVIFLIVRKKKK